MVDLDELERLEREATPRPWEHERMGSIVADVAGVRRQVASVLGNAAMHGDVEREPYDIRDATSEMIVATRNALPDLIAELRTLRARVAELERDLDACRVELLEAQHTVGEGWLAGGATLAEAIERKCRMLERNNETACENTPWPGCECPGCETARERADAAAKGGSDG